MGRLTTEPWRLAVIGEETDYKISTIELCAYQFVHNCLSRMGNVGLAAGGLAGSNTVVAQYLGINRLDGGVGKEQFAL